MKAARKTVVAASIAPTPLSYYEVSDCGTITDPSVREPEVRSDVFEGVSTEHIRTRSQLISEVAGCTPLENHFTYLAGERLADIESELDLADDSLGAIERRRLSLLAVQLRKDPESGWQKWVKSEGDPGLPMFKEHIQDWLDDDIDWDESDWFDDLSSGQSAAFHLFSDFDADTLKAIGVVIIEGDCPGSSYCAAELRVSIALANQAADARGLQIRFHDEGQNIAVDCTPQPVSNKGEM